ncbi:hypothetical protein ACTQ6A_12500 [Lachnospiraceae bacterium LCP25S3_G4]
MSEFLALKKELDNINDKKLVALKIRKYNFSKNGGWYISEAIKVFRNKHDIRYEGTINESIKSSIGVEIQNLVSSQISYNNLRAVQSCRAQI